MEARRFLDTAKSLSNAGTQEADFRSAISRAYYAAFHVVKQKTASKVNYTVGSEHSAARIHLKAAWSKEQANRFERLQSRRIESDYDLALSISKLRADETVKLAEAFILAVDAGVR